jgi:hypothetical protein
VIFRISDFTKYRPKRLIIKKFNNGINIINKYILFTFILRKKYFGFALTEAIALFSLMMAFLILFSEK